jgi:fructose-1-phosphate kinase PfkB-like protein
MKTTEQLTLQELAQNSCSVSLYNIPGKVGINIEITMLDYQSTRVIEHGMHPIAVENMASFCKYFLKSYDRVLTERGTI